MATQKIAPFLWFDNQAEAAAQFYTSIFKDSKILETSRYGDAGPGPKGSVMVVKFQIAGMDVTAPNGGPRFTFSEAFSFVMSCDNQAAIDEYWRKRTSDGGEESMCGWLKDKFGFSWQIVPKQMGKLMSQKDPQKSNRVMQALLQMKKLDVANSSRRAKTRCPSAVDGPHPALGVTRARGATQAFDLRKLGARHRHGEGADVFLHVFAG